ncbi:MAG: hypothetical protein WBL45_07995 [Solirubrobacterales bacterium]
MPFDSLLDLVENPVETDIAVPSGQKYRSKTYAFWDMDPHDSDLFARVEVTGRGLRRHQSYFGVEVRGPEDDFAPGPAAYSEVSSTWTEKLGLAVVLLIVAVFTVPWVVGIGFLLSRVF